MRKQNITPAQIAQIQRLRAEGATANNAAASLGVSVTTVQRYSRANKGDISQRRRAEAEASGKRRVLAAVKKSGPFPSMDELAAILPEIDPHTIQHHLHTLRTQGQVRFRETSAGTNQHRLVGIEAVPQRFRNGEAGFSARTTSTHPGDPTDYHNQPSVAPGGPITRIGPTPPVTMTVRRLDVDVPPIVMAPAAYPILRGLIERAAKIETAAKLLEQAGQDDLALTALSKVDDYTDLEREAIALLKAAIAAGVVPA